MMRFALLLSLLAFGALGLVACDDDDQTAATEIEVIRSDSEAGGCVAIGPNACAAYRRGPGDIRYESYPCAGALCSRRVVGQLPNLSPVRPFQ